MINNFDQISALLKFDDADDFYFIQILQRNKEHPSLGSNNRRLREYYIHSKEHLMEVAEEIRIMCRSFNARAYIHLNRRNRKQIALEMLELLAHNIKCSQYQGISRLYESVCGKHHSEKDKTWLVDIDTHDADLTDNVIFSINRIRNKYHTAETLIHIIPTLNGVHLITPSFDSKDFSEVWAEEIRAKIIDIHKNNPTLLYIP